jgi:uncharacterized protein YndB with AHSA1/START domain
MNTMTALATQVYQVFIRATPEQIWEAITTPEFTEKYFYGTKVTVDAEHYSSLGDDGGELVWGDVEEFDPPRRLVHSWLSMYDPEMAAEQASRVTWQIEQQEGGFSLLSVTHDHLENSPKTAESVSGVGWMLVLSGLKTLLETGEPLVTF